MQNFFQPANVVDLIAPRDLRSGEGFVVGVIFGVATKDAKTGAVIPTLVEGGVGLKKAAGYTPTAGAAANFDHGAAVQTLGATGGKVVGYVILPNHPDDATFAVVKLVPTTA